MSPYVALGNQIAPRFTHRGAGELPPRVHLVAPAPSSRGAPRSPSSAQYCPDCDLDTSSSAADRRPRLGIGESFRFPGLDRRFGSGTTLSAADELRTATMATNTSLDHRTIGVSGARRRRHSHLEALCDSVSNPRRQGNPARDVLSFTHNRPRLLTVGGAARSMSDSLPPNLNCWNRHRRATTNRISL